MTGARSTMLALLPCILCACRSTPASSPDPSPPSPVIVRHAWPMVHHDAARSGGSMELPFLEEAPAPPVSFALRGRLARFNAPVITRDDVACVGSIGLTRGQPDEADGVTCIDLAGKEELWFTRTDSDAHGTSLGATHLFVGTQAGELVALDLATGEVAWSHELPAAITASPLALQAPAHLVVIADTQGHVHALDARTGASIWEKKLDGAIVSGLASAQGSLIAATTTGHVHALALDDGATRWQRRISYSQSQAHSLDTVSSHAARIEAAPVIAQDRVIIAYVRDEPGSTPPMVALALDTGELLWEATARTPHHSRWQSQHVSPVFVEDRLIFTEAYSKLFASVSLDHGEMLFLSNRPMCIHQQWSSLVHASDISYAPRHDGVLYALSQQYGLSPWHVFAEDDSPDYFEKFKAVAREGDCLADPPDHDGFLTTPALTVRGGIVLGRADGVLLHYAPVSP